MDKAERAGYRSAIKIDDLREEPEHRPAVADRLWHAWWKPYGHALSDVEAALGEVLAAQGFPFTLIATRDGRFLGTVTGIQSDIHQRPNLGPCLAALWVEPEARGQGMAQLLMAAVLERLYAHGFDQVYLSAKPHLCGFYQSRGWSQIESDVGDDRLGVFVRALP
ncbi:MAG: GNAT family N-acetyltransferase [Devosia sp.]